MSEENSSGFKVMDRRLFNADGSLRDDAVIEEAPAPEPIAPPLPPVPPRPTAPQFSAADITGAARPAAPPPPPPMAPPPPQPMAQPMGQQDIGAEPEQTMFTEFLMRVASEAFIYLGLVAHPMTGQPQVDMEAAKETIEMLLMLQHKTQGNLTPGEARFYEDLMADLKMQYVSMMQQR
jgi:Domain of unknown function (DUF1844)